MSENTIQNYLKLEENIKQISHLAAITSLAHWDSAVMMPPGAASSKQQELATVSSIIHKMSTSSEIGDLISLANDEKQYLDSWQQSNLELIKKSYNESLCVDHKMTHELSIAAGESEFAWRKCRADNDFKTMVPYLDRLFKAVITVAKAKSEKLGKSEYDVLINNFDPERKVSEINSVYDVLKKELPELMHKIIHKQSSEKVIELTEEISPKTQKKIGLKIIEKMGFDLTRGRLDKSTHPFCIGGRNDVRITTRYDKKNFLSSLFGIIHETGHGLYQQALPADYAYFPVGNAKGMAFHESQSLIMEMQAATTIQFNEFLAKLLKDEFGFKGPEYEAENLYKLMTRVKPGFIRVDSDEVTYPLHVILRFEIEQEIINGTLKAADLPEIWNNKMKEYLGITPGSDSNGCLQDIHWPSGLLGYFPSYTNGAIIASMLMKKIKEQHDVGSQLSQGNFSSINNYLNEHLRSKGSLKSSKELLLESTGFEEIQPKILIEYLENKYLS